MIKVFFYGVAGFLIATFWMADQAHSARYCRIDNVSFDRVVGDAVDARVSLICRSSKFSGGIRYPTGTAFLGITLFRVRDMSAVSHDDASWDGSYLDLPYVRFDTREAEPQVQLSTSESTRGFNKFVAAVWTKEVRCWDRSRAAKCLGPAGAYGMPLPVDTYPRPNCDPRKIEQVTDSISSNVYFGEEGHVFNFTREDVERVDSFIASQHCMFGYSMHSFDVLYDDSLNGIGFGFAIGKWPIANFRPR